MVGLVKEKANHRRERSDFLEEYGLKEKEGDVISRDGKRKYENPSAFKRELRRRTQSHQKEVRANSGKKGLQKRSKEKSHTRHR